MQDTEWKIPFVNSAKIGADCQSIHTFNQIINHSSSNNDAKSVINFLLHNCQLFNG